MPKQTLAEALAQQVPNNGGPSCVVCDMLPTLDKQDVAALNAALDNPRITGTMIVRALSEYGATVSISTLRRHRRKECAAFRNVG